MLNQFEIEKKRRERERRRQAEQDRRISEGVARIVDNAEWDAREKEAREKRALEDARAKSAAARAEQLKVLKSKARAAYPGTDAEFESDWPEIEKRIRIEQAAQAALVDKPSISL